VKQSNNTHDSLVEFLTEFASYLVKHGVSLSEFHGAARVAFLQAAADHARLRNSRINQSALATITGLSRPQVRKILKAIEEKSVGPGGRIPQVLEGWRRDPDFWDSGLGPHRLPIKGSNQSFAGLVRKYGRDVTPKAVLDELENLGYARVNQGFVSLTRKGLKLAEPRGLQQLTAGLTFVLKRPAAAQFGTAVVAADAFYRTPDRKSRLLMKRRLLQSAKAFVADVKATGDAEASKSNRKNDALSRTSILVITSE